MGVFCLVLGILSLVGGIIGFLALQGSPVEGLAGIYLASGLLGFGTMGGMWKIIELLERIAASSVQGPAASGSVQPAAPPPPIRELTPEEKAEKKKRDLLFIGGLLLALAVVVGLAFLFGPTQAPTRR